MKAFSLIALGASLLAVVVLFNQPVNSRVLDEPIPLPEFTGQAVEQWINSEPMTVNDLRGKVVLLDIWTFDCWNCYRSFPWLTDLEQRFESKGLQVIGIHSPEFEHEKKRDNVIAKMKKFGLHHPVMLDNDFRYWKALNNHYWPAFYLIDKQGRIRASFIGETHKGDANAERIEQMIGELLAE
ncbi:MAG: redoxin domain-containing protein [Chromatiales bacterium]|jgi:thiol-disulfide isomerase/thioredoxin